MYNAINFNWGINDSTASICNKINNTVIYAKVAAFLCPSDPNAGNPNLNNYHASLGTTSLGGNQGSDGMFTYQRSYGLRDVIDGSSSTIAFGEANTGPAQSGYNKSIVLVKVTSLPNKALQLSVYNSPSSILSGMAICDSVYQSRTATLDLARGKLWGKGSQGHSLFNTLVTPSSKQHIWSGCALANIGQAAFNNAGSFHPGGANVVFADGSVHFIKDSVNQNTRWGLGTRASGEILSSDSF